MKVAELEGNALDERVMKALLMQFSGSENDADTRLFVSQVIDAAMAGKDAFHPSINWGQAGFIIETGAISIEQCGPFKSKAWIRRPFGTIIKQEGRTPLIAAMRVYVADAFGDEVPDGGI